MYSKTTNTLNVLPEDGQITLQLNILMMTLVNKTMQNKLYNVEKEERF